jgi:hypothetical protein
MEPLFSSAPFRFTPSLLYALVFVGFRSGVLIHREFGVVKRPLFFMNPSAGHDVTRTFHLTEKG